MHCCVLVLVVLVMVRCAIVDTAGTKASTNKGEIMDYENLPDGTFIEFDGHLLPVTPNHGYWVAVDNRLRGGGRHKAPFIGVWTASDGEQFVEQSRWVADYDKAVKLGRIHNQYAIWDCAKNEEIALHLLEEVA